TAWRWVSAEWLRSRIPGDIVDHEQIEPSIVIVVEPSGGNGPAALRQTGAGRHVVEGPVATVAVEADAAQAGDHQVHPAIVVEIGRRHPHRVSGAAQTGF